MFVPSLRKYFVTKGVTFVEDEVFFFKNPFQGEKLDSEVYFSAVGTSVHKIPQVMKVWLGRL